MSSWVSIDKGSRTDLRSDRLDATTGTKPFGKSKCHYTGGIYFDKIHTKFHENPFPTTAAFFGTICTEPLDGL